MTQPEYDGGRPDDDLIRRPDAQPWDPAYQDAYPPGADPSGAYAPNAYPPSSYPPGSYPPGSYPPGSYPPGSYPPGAYSPGPYPPGGYPAAYGAPMGSQPAPRRRRRTALALGVGGIAVATALAVGIAIGANDSVNGSAVAAAGGSSNSSGSSGGSTTTPGSGNTVPGNGNFPFPGNGQFGNGSSGNGTSSATTASAAQQVGVVDIVTVQKYAQAEAAGTGMVLTSNGEILTNNHVIDGATSIKVTVVSTGKSYTARVVGTVPTKDIAVLQLQNASGLKTINLGDSSKVSVGDAVTGVGNAGGAGGTPSAATGKVTELGRTITASDEDGSTAETLHGVIVIDAPIQAGDSGGPLYNAKNEVIGIDTAASTSGQSAGFAIPINTALSVAAQIEKGVETSSVHIGYPGFLGISVTPGQVSGALVAGVLSGGPAADAGITAGDVITRVGSTTISSSTQLQSAISSHNPGSKVSVTYTDPSTGKHTVTVTLATGPAD